jgi:hypothetical protein
VRGNGCSVRVRRGRVLDQAEGLARRLAAARCSD